VNTKTSAALLFLASFALYFIARAPALDKHDSVHLADILDFNIYSNHRAARIYAIDRHAP
jgi:hypothetical protein